MAGRDRSLALNEEAHRKHNERVEDRVHIFVGEEPSLGIVCECDRETCDERLTVTVSEYEHTRSDPLLFIVVPGHEDSRIERVRRKHDYYLIVQKTGEAAEVAEETSDR